MKPVQKAELDMHNARDAHEVAAIDEMTKRDRLNKLIAELSA